MSSTPRDASAPAPRSTAPRIPRVSPQQRAESCYWLVIFLACVAGSLLAAHVIASLGVFA